MCIMKWIMIVMILMIMIMKSNDIIINEIMKK